MTQHGKAHRWSPSVYVLLRRCYYTEASSFSYHHKTQQVHAAVTCPEPFIGLYLLFLDPNAYHATY